MNSPEITRALTALVQQIKRQPDVSEVDVQSLSRMLRPRSSESSSHTTAIMHKMKSQILAHADR